MTTSGTMSDKEWKRSTTSDSKWQLMTINKWEQVKNDFMFQNETKDQSGSWVILFNFYVICNYYIFSCTDNLKIGKLMTNIFNRIFRVSLILVFLYFFRYDFFLKLLEHDKLIANWGLFFFLKLLEHDKLIANCGLFFLKLLEHDKLIANCGLFFENIMQNRTSVFN